MKYAIYDILLHLAMALSLPYFIFKALTTHKYREGLVERLGPDRGVGVRPHAFDELRGEIAAIRLTGGGHHRPAGAA